MRRPPLMRMRPLVQMLLLSLNHKQTNFFPKMESYHGPAPHVTAVRVSKGIAVVPAVSMEGGTNLRSFIVRPAIKSVAP